MRDLKVMNERDRRIFAIPVDMWDKITNHDARYFYYFSEIQFYSDLDDFDTIYMADNKSTHEVISIKVTELESYLLNLKKEMEA